MDQRSINAEFVERHFEAVNLGKPEIFPFPISIPERDLIDLRTRLDRTRLPEPETVPDATQGIELERLKVLLDAWRQHDWRGLEKRWNAIYHWNTLG
jgi:epoxide hydrolase